MQLTLHGLPAAEKVLKQPIPLWAGYNSLVTTDDRPITTVHTLPLLRSPANPKLIKSVPIFYAVDIDNIDFDEDTADGKHTLHGTVVVAFQALNKAAHISVLQPMHQSSAVLW